MVNMAKQEKDKDVAAILESLLASYSSVEPRFGLERRILARLRDKAPKESTPAWWTKWLWAGAVLVAVGIVAGILIGGHRELPPPTKTLVETGHPALLQPEVRRNFPASAAVAAYHRRKISGPLQTGNALPSGQRLPVFPTPVPLSEQEQLLLSYVAGTPREEVVAQSRPDELTVDDQDQSRTMPDQSHVPQTLNNTQ
jgi:hypothetical protein